VDVDVEVVFAALASPVRLAAVQRLAHGPATSGQLAQLGPVSRPAMSQHLRVLAEAELVRSAASGRNVWYELQPATVEGIRIWADTLLARHAAAPALRPRAPHDHDERRSHARAGHLRGGPQP
jgi:DNA-binding transcriptional ArsR family regulator